MVYITILHIIIIIIYNYNSITKSIKKTKERLSSLWRFGCQFFSLESNSFVFDSFLIIVIVYIRILPPVRSTTTTIPWTHCFKLYFIVKLIIEDEEEEQKPNSVLLLLGFFFLVVPLRFLFIHSFSQSVSFFFANPSSLKRHHQYWSFIIHTHTHTNGLTTT